jgi:hypothetical protein
MLLKDGVAKRAVATLDVELSESIRNTEDGDDNEATTVDNEQGADGFERALLPSRRRGRVSDLCYSKFVAS